MTLEEATLLKQKYFNIIFQHACDDPEYDIARREHYKYYKLVEWLRKSPSAQLCQVAQEIGNDT